MKKISKIQASKRILKIAKQVALVQASNNKLTPLEIAKVQKAVGMILASADIDDKTLEKIEALDEQGFGTNNPQKVMQQLIKNKSTITKQKNKQMKGNKGVQEYLKMHGLRLTKPMKVGELFKVINELLINYQEISTIKTNPQQVIEVQDEQNEQKL